MRITEVPPVKPVMTICRSGKRLVLAFGILRDAGCSRVTGIKGCLLRWTEQGLPLV